MFRPVRPVFIRSVHDGYKETTVHITSVFEKRKNYESIFIFEWHVIFLKLM